MSIQTDVRVSEYKIKERMSLNNKFNKKNISKTTGENAKELLKNYIKNKNKNIYEKYEDNKDEDDKDEDNKSINKEHFYGQELEEPYGNDDDMPIKPVNFYGETYNSSNFSSDVMDLNKFYKNNFNNKFVTPYEQNITYNSIELENQIKNKPINNNEFIDVKTKNFTYLDRMTNDGRGTFKPDFWKYNNESMMNGAPIFNGVSGFDSMNNNLAIYNGDNKIIANNCTDNNLSLATDDLRMGMGNPGRNERLTR